MSITARPRAVPWRRRLAAATAVAALVVAACGPNTASSTPAPTAAPDGGTGEGGLPSGPVELRVAYYNAGGQTEVDYRQAQAEAFMALHPNVTVMMEPVSDWGEQIYPQLAAGTAADVLWIDTDTGYGTMVGLGAWQSLAPFIEKDGYDLTPWPQTMIDHFSGPDGLLILPNSNLSFNFLYYNKGIFDDAGLPYPSNDWTLEQMLDAARKLTVPGERWGLTLAWNELYVTWMQMYGCQLADSASGPTTYTYNGPGCAKALADLDALSREGVLNWDFGALGPGDTAGEANFSLGNVGMLLSGTWEAGSIASNSGGAFEFDASAAPLASNGTIQGAASGYGVYAKAKNPEWAWEYVKYLAGPEGQTADNEVGLGQSPIASILDGVYCASDAPPASKCEIAKIGAAKTKWEPVTDKWSPGFWDIVSPGLEAGFTAPEAPDWQAILDDLVAKSQQAAPLP